MVKVNEGLAVPTQDQLFLIVKRSKREHCWLFSSAGLISELKFYSK